MPESALHTQDLAADVIDTWTVAPIRKSVRAATTVERSFAVFTEDVDSCWPRPQRTGGVDADWLDTDIEFEIFRDLDRTILHFRHSNWREDAKQFPHCSMGWAIFLLSLKEFVETGKGRPYPYDMPVNMWTPPTQLS